MAKLTPQPHIDYTKNDPIHLQLGPPSESFTYCEQSFEIKISEMLWPNHLPITEKQVRDAIARYMNPRSLEIKVQEIN